jgi:excisionase family DNA binding protein
MNSDTSPSPAKIAYSIAEAVRASGMSRSAIYLALKSGDLRGVKLGRRTLVRHEDLAAYIARLPALGKVA